MVILLSLLAVSCKQDPIFFIIANETAPKKPRIEGAPTNMVVFEREYRDPDGEHEKITVPIMYVASGRLHWYAKAPGADKPQWDSNEYPFNIPQPVGKIISLAAAGNRLYALSMDDAHGVNTTLRYIESDGNKWKESPPAPTDYPSIQSIYAASADTETTVDPETTVNSVTITSRLFAGAGKNDRGRATYAILYLDNTYDTFKILKSDTFILSGAAYREEEDIYYLCTRGDGIFHITETELKEADLTKSNISSVSQLKENNASTFMGTIKLKDDQSTVIAVARNGGALYKVYNGSFEQISGSNGNIATGRYATGALALWNEIDSVTGNTTPKMLIAGIQGGLYSTTTSSYTHGYVEFDLKEDGSFDTDSNSRAPDISINGNIDRYTASLGKHPINYLFQAPKEVDENMTFFASTQTKGLWSYRDRPDNGGWQWNAEE